jgi:hypothetical protein
MSLYLYLNRLLYISWKLKMKSSYSIQENNYLQNKMVERTYHEVLSTVVNELLHPPFGDLHSARASPQTASLGSAHVQET